MPDLRFVRFIYTVIQMGARVFHSNLLISAHFIHYFDSLLRTQNAAFLGNHWIVSNERVDGQSPRVFFFTHSAAIVSSLSIFFSRSLVFP